MVQMRIVSLRKRLQPPRRETARGSVVVVYAAVCALRVLGELLAATATETGRLEEAAREKPMLHPVPTAVVSGVEKRVLAHCAAVATGERAAAQGVDLVACLVACAVLAPGAAADSRMVGGVASRATPFVSRAVATPLVLRAIP